MDKDTLVKKIVFYEDEEGNSPVEQFPDCLDESAKAKITARIEFLGKYWRQVRRPLVDYLEDGLYEFEKLVQGGRIRLL